MLFVCLFLLLFFFFNLSLYCTNFFKFSCTYFSTVFLLVQLLQLENKMWMKMLSIFLYHLAPTCLNDVIEESKHRVLCILFYWLVFQNFVSEIGIVLCPVMCHILFTFVHCYNQLFVVIIVFSYNQLFLVTIIFS